MLVIRTVVVKDFTSTPYTWIKVTSPVSYMVELRSGQTVRRHVDAVLRRTDICASEESEQTSDVPTSTTSSTSSLPPSPSHQPRSSTRNRARPEYFAGK